MRAAMTAPASLEELDAELNALLAEDDADRRRAAARAHGEALLARLASFEERVADLERATARMERLVEERLDAFGVDAEARMRSAALAAAASVRRALAPGDDLGVRRVAEEEGE